ncbi:MAG: TIR domain-containing protein [Chloroflexota bacterium]
MTQSKQTSDKQYDIFLSHNSEDKDAVSYLAGKLREAHYNPFLDTWHIIPGEPWQEAIEDALAQSRTCAVFLGGSKISPWQNEEMRSVLDRRTRDNHLRVIPVLLPGASDPEEGQMPPFLSRLALVDFRSGIDDSEGLRRLISGIEGLPPEPIGQPKPPGGLLDEVSPFSNDTFFMTVRRFLYLVRLRAVSPRILAAIITAIAIILAAYLLRPDTSPETANINCHRIADVPQDKTTFAIGYEMDTDENEKEWAQQITSALYQKFSHVDAVQGFFYGDSETAKECKADLDYWIEVDVKHSDTILVSANISEGTGAFRSKSTPESILVDPESPSIESQILVRQDKLFSDVLNEFQLQLSEDILHKINNTPTIHGEALSLNNSAYRRLLQFSNSSSEDGLSPEEVLSTAEKMLRDAIKLDARYADAHHNLGTIFYFREDFENAKNQYELALALLPNNPSYLYSLASVLELLDENQAAIQAFQRSWELDPLRDGISITLNNLGFTYLKIGELDNALAVLQEALDLEPNSGISHILYKNMGRVRLGQDQPEQAVLELTQALELANGPYPEASYYLAKAYQQLDQVEDACQVITALLTPITPGVSPEEVDEYTDKIKGLEGELNCLALD